jgi:hypothetical protein
LSAVTQRGWSQHEEETLPVQLPRAVGRALRAFRVDFALAHRQPSPVSLVATAIASVAGSLATARVAVASASRQG